MRLEDIEHAADDQASETENLTKEAEDHHRKSEQLKETLNRLWDAHAEAGSDELREAIENTQEAQRETDRELEECRVRREELLAENKNLLDKCERAIAKKKAALEWGSQAAESVFGSPRKGSMRELLVKNVVASVDKAIDRAEDAKDHLQKARRVVRDASHGSDVPYGADAATKAVRRRPQPFRSTGPAQPPPSDAGARGSRATGTRQSEETSGGRYSAKLCLHWLARRANP